MDYRGTLLLTLSICFCNILLLEAQDSVLPPVIDDSNETVDKAAYKTTFAYNDENRKPTFSDCESYKPSVKEQEPKGTPVITVKATDPDPPNKKGGKIKYSMVQADGQRIFFTINTTTGDVYTNAPFDRDEPSRQKELYVTVQATDDGRPPLADICTFKVTVEDINDNMPSFDQQDYRADISEDAHVKSEVMRVFAYDFDYGENSRLTYSFSNESNSNNFNDYFRIDPKTGVVYLLKELKSKQMTKFSSTVIVQDNGVAPNKAAAEISITVVSSDKQAPRITEYEREIIIAEDWYDSEVSLVKVVAESNINDKSVAFELVKGKTIQTNRDQTFTLNPVDDNSAEIKLVRHLDYETVTEYQLTVRAQNKDKLGTSININVKVTDVNDEIPTFIELLKGSIIENDNVSARAMQVRAIDKDGTSPNNVVNYELVSHTDLFEIDKESGVITSKAVFDREEESLYYVMVRAYDLAPSAILRDKTKPNSVNQTFQISIEDRNDNQPKFQDSLYVVHNISESADRGFQVIEVNAIDRDDASLILYSILDGNVDNAFMIEDSTGRIKVHGKLDFEKIESYNLTVQASDGMFQDTAKVIIHIQNENDEPPVFENYTKLIEIKEETTSDGCIINLKAYDPDIKDRSVHQRITYTVAKEHRSFLDVTVDGCVSLIKRLDRDPPNGSPQYQGYIYANDNDGGSNSLHTSAEIILQLIDINDNAPTLNITEVVWYENENPGKIVTLTAIDYDSSVNGPPFYYEIAEDGNSDYQGKFSVIGSDLMALVVFDREAQKFYDVPIKITDSGEPEQLSGVSILRVIIGDRNDNEAQPGSSEIFVYKYQDLNTDIKIGRVYVEDPDDWDLPDKIFQLVGVVGGNFRLSTDDIGMIVMGWETPAGVYRLNFQVTEEHLPDIPRHTINANVTVTVKDIPEEAVQKSGSIRLEGATIEQFIEKNPDYGLSKKDLLQKNIARILNVSLDNVDVFTVLPSPTNSSFVDVRFSAHGSPYYAPEKLNNKATEQQDALERELGVKFIMVSINECLLDTSCPPKSSCSSILQINEEPAVVFTNKTSFVGIKAITEADCNCVMRTVSECFNGGSPIDGGACSCPEGSEGPHCEILKIGFDGNGWAMYPTFDACNDTEITLSILPQSEDGLIFYVGPLTMKHAILSKDFMSLELRDGYIVLKLDLGNGPREIPNNKKKLNDGAMHKIKILIRTTDDVQISVDECLSDCLAWQSLNGGLLNVNGPLQIGGRRNIFTSEQSKMVWDKFAPTNKGFSGCIANFTYNSYVYNLGSPSDSYGEHINCNYSGTQAATFGIDSNFLVAILVCIAILLILLLAVVVHKRKQDNLNEKDMDDTRENIINYEDEGGGECDTNFDLSVLRPNLDEKPPIRDNLYKQGAEVPADISGFLDSKKRTCDKDPDNLPYDDVRHYGYEGDGNTSGSLSSLASCTDEGDLKFNYLSSFGPRFRKLADMYGDDASEEGSQNGGEESWC